MDPAKLHQLSDSPLWNLPDTDPRCNNVSCMAYLVGYLEEQHVYSNDRYPKYAFWATYFYCATIGLFTIMYINSRIRDGGSGTRFKERTIAAWRWWTYRRIPGWLGTQMDISLGQLALFTSATIFIAIIAFLHGHYLRNYFKYGSPPLSVRSAIIISALLPICLAVAGKVNIVSVITGISYAKLNVWHRYLAFMIFILSIVHLVPHFIAPIREGGVAELRQLLKEGRRERSGIVLQFSFTLMLLFSLPSFRNRFYEVFKFLHIFFAIAFFFLYYWHIGGEALTPDMFWATVGIMVGNSIARVVYRNRVRTTLTEFTKGFPTSLEVLPGSMTRVAVQCPRKLQWKPGQHCYITIPGISRLQAHPFTIVSLPGSQYKGGPHDIVLLVRTCKGFTKDVEELAMRTSRTWSVSTLGSWQSTAEYEMQMNARAWIDGPYGDYIPALEKQYQDVICIAGGSGITTTIPWISHLATRMRAASQLPKNIHGEKTCKTRTLHLVWSIRRLSWLRWAEREIGEAMRDVVIANVADLRISQELRDGRPRKQTNYTLKILIYVTGQIENGELKEAESELYLGAGIDMHNPFATVQIVPGRPHYTSLLPNMIDRKRNMIITCGPISQKIDVANSVAKLQSMVFNDQASEIALHSETFGW